MTTRRLIGVDLDLIGRRGRMAAAAAIVGLAGFGTAILYGARAGELALARRFEPETAALLVAGAAAAVAVVALVGALVVVDRTRRDVRRAVTTSAVATFGPPAVSFAARHTRLAGVAAAVGIGFWLARRQPRS